MTATPYDAIVIGARCAGSPTAMLLARRGLRVLALDRDSFPSDTISTHLIHPPGVAALERWGLLPRLLATGCPPINTYAFDFGPFTISGSPGTAAAPVAYAPRRTVLDQILVDAAREAGAEVREGFVVEELLFENGKVVGLNGRGASGPPVTERAQVVIGADGRSSLVAREAKAEAYHEKPAIEVSYYSYWSGLPMNGRFESYIRDGVGFAAWPTHHDQTLIVAGWPIAEFDAVRKDVEGHYLAALATSPAFQARMRGAKREDRFYGISVPNYFRKPYGPGWALVGDSGYNKDFITAQGITDAFRDAEGCAAAVADSLAGIRPFDTAMAEHQTRRDAHALPMYEFTQQIAMLAPPKPELQQLLGAVYGNQDAMDGFARVNAGVTSPSEFFNRENIGRIFAEAAARPATAS